MHTHALDHRLGSWFPMNKVQGALAFVVLVVALRPATWLYAADPVAQQLMAARSQLREAKTALEEVTQRLKTELEESDPEWAGLCRAARDAETERTRVQGILIAATRVGSEYVKMQKALAEAQEVVRQLTESHQMAGGALARASEQVFTIEMRLRGTEMEAMRGSAEMYAAISRVQHCASNMSAYWNRYASDVLPMNLEWVEAVSRRDAAAAAVRHAEASFAEARRQDPVFHVRSSGSNRTRSSYGSSSGARRSSYR